ncbi:MAG: 6-bladed beta-propeller, partial [Gemmatimonadetes bacterium]|nr:6-bladed beta-propeller [Gemmatimonadota bacterium]
LEVDAAGRIYVLDRQEQEIRVFDARGAYVRTIGRKGRGPGEFQGANGMEWDRAGNLWVADPMNTRYTVFDTAGRFLRTYRRPIPSYGYSWEGGFDREGRLYDTHFAAAGPRPEDRVHALVRFDSDMQPRDTFPLPYAEEEAFRLETRGGTTRIFFAVPFAPRMHWLLDPRGYIWFGFPDRYRIYQRRLKGDTARMIEREAKPVPVSRAERQREIERLQPVIGQGAQVDLSRIPRFKPAFEGLLLDDAGRLWVLLPRADRDLRTSFDVFSPDGRYLAHPRIEAHLLGGVGSPLLLRGDRLYGVVRDELDVPHVIRARIDR